MLLARAVDGGFSDLIEKRMGFTVEHAVALLDGGLTDGLSQMRLYRCRADLKTGRLHAWR